MENLTKQQIILLTLLVSFVTSIATGIVTVSLLDQAPPGVTQTINRVVEKTIEHVVQVPTTQSATVVQKETVVVKQDDETVSAIEKNGKSVVRIFREGVTEANPDIHPLFQGLGFVVTKDGVIASDAVVLGEGKMTAQFSDGVTLPLSVVFSHEGSSTVLLKAETSEKNPYTFIPVVLGDSNAIKLGQSVIAVTGRESNTVSTGIISNLKIENQKDSNATTSPDTHYVLSVETTIPDSFGSVGAPLLSLSGEVIGLKLQENEIVGRGSFTPISVVAGSVQKLIFDQAKAGIVNKK